MSVYGTGMKIFTGTSHFPLANEIAKCLGRTLSDSEITRFSDGEINVSIYDSVRGKDVFIIQSTSNPVNDNIMELLLMADAFKRSSAARITAVMPYFGYARQDRKAKAHDPISAKLVADIITVSGCNRVLTMDLHAPQLQGFFNIPLDHLYGGQIIAPYLLEKFGKGNDEIVVVSPDLGAVPRSRKFAVKCDYPLAVIDKRRSKPNVSEVVNIIGDVKGRTCIIVDDLIDTAGTVCNGVSFLLERGAKEVYVAATHGVLSGSAVERFSKTDVREVILLDTIDIPKEKILPNFTILGTATHFAEAIERVHEGLPMSVMFDK